MKLFSVIILCYNNYKYIYDGIQSIFTQNYDNIELIISDDASKDFPAETIKDYINNHKTSNISSVIVRQEKTNQGTVRHLNNTIKCAKGDFICFLACDDIFYNENTLSNYVKGFSAAQDDCYIEMAQTAMYDENLKTFEYYYMPVHIQKLIEQHKYPELLAEISYYPYLPSTSTCFKSKFFKIYGDFDEQYTLIEDVPLHLRLFDENIMLFYNNFIAIKHRHGGISHSNNVISPTKIKYYQDIAKIYKLSKSRIDQLPVGYRHKLETKLQASIIWCDYILLWLQPSLSAKCSFIAKHPFNTIQHLLLLFNRVSFQTIGKLFVLDVVLFLTTEDILYSLKSIFGLDIRYILSTTMDMLFHAFFVIICILCLKLISSIFQNLDAFPLNILYIISNRKK